MNENRDIPSFYENASFDLKSPNFDDVMVLTDKLKVIKQNMELSPTQVEEIVTVIKFVLQKAQVSRYIELTDEPQEFPDSEDKEEIPKEAVAEQNQLILRDQVQEVIKND